MNEKWIQLGDIIHVISPKEPEFHGKTFFVYYFDPNGPMELVQTSSMELKTLQLQGGTSNQISNWEKIELYNRPIHKGFARQNGLLPGQWVELEFKTDVREIITASIQHLEEDMITLLTHPTGNLLYIDFAYKGIPKNIPLQGICICNPPKSTIAKDSTTTSDDDDDDTKTTTNDKDNDSDDFDSATTVEESVVPTGEIEILVPDNVTMENDFIQDLETEAFEALKETKNEETPIEDPISIPKPTLLQVRYNVEIQMNDLLESLVHKIPEEDRTRSVLKSIYNHIDRFKELREEFSAYDSSGKIIGPLTHNPKLHKPLLQNMNSPYNVSNQWALPIIDVKRYYYQDMEEIKIMNDGSSRYSSRFQNGINFGDPLMDEKKALSEFYETEPVVTSTKINYYEQMLKTVGEKYWKPFQNNHDAVIFDDEMLSINRDNDTIIYDTTGDGIFPKYSTLRVNGPVSSIVGDNVLQKSWMLLPEKYIYDVNNTAIQSSILEKCNYKSPYLFLFLQSKRVKSIVLSPEQIEKRLSGQNEDIIHPLLSPDLLHLDLTSSSASLDKTKPEDVLRCIIPNAFALVEKYKSKNANAYNLYDYVKPYWNYQYTSSSLPFTAMKMIRYNIQENIRKYHDDRKVAKINMNQYLVNSNSPYKANFLKPYFTDAARNLITILAKSYRMKIETDAQRNVLIAPFSGNEFLRELQLKDNNSLFCHLLVLQNAGLITPSMDMNIVEQRHFYDNTQKSLAKKYPTIQAMQKDNDMRDLKYDKTYDANQYDMMDKYKSQKASMQPDEFRDFIANVFSEEYGCSVQNTEALAQEFIQGYKLVKEGDYALVEIIPRLDSSIQEYDLTENERNELVIEANVRKKQEFYKRVGHTWVYDDSVDMSAFAKPEDLTCLLKSKSNQGDNRSFVEKYGSKKAEIEDAINREIVKVQKMVEENNNAHYKKAIRFDWEHSYMASVLEGTDERVVSPYQETLDLIHTRNNDFATKQDNIRHFRHKCCRDAMEHENQYWFYCKETGLPLLPRFEYDLANAFYRKNYEETLVAIKRNARKQDGYYYDIHTGRVICEMDYFDEYSRDDDDYDFAVEDTNVIDTDMKSIGSNMEINEDLHKQQVYSDPKMKKCYHIAKAVCKNLYISLDKVEVETMELCSQFLLNKKMFISREKYEKAYLKQKEAEEKKQTKKKVIPYDEYYNALLLSVVTCCLIVAIQTKTPSILPKRTFGQCIKELSGYPLVDDITKDGTIVYMACILRAMYTDTYPWKTISKSKGKLEKKLLETMRTDIVTHEAVQKLIGEKREYLEKSTTNSAIPDTIDLQHKWARFQPPSMNTKIVDHTDGNKPITKTVHELFEKSIRTGDKGQWTYSGMYFGKAVLFSLGIAEMVNAIVKEKGHILGLHTPFPAVENACCNELEYSSNPVLYFQTEDEKIRQYQTNIAKISQYFDHSLKPLSFANMLLSEPKYSKNQLESSKGFIYDEHSMYKTFIHYLNLDSTIKPIPTYLKPYMAEKPEQYNRNGSLEEKIHFLKNNNTIMNVKQFSSILSTVYKSDIIKIVEPLEVQHKRAVLSSWEEWKLCVQNTLVNTTSEEVNKPIQTIHELLEKYFERKNIVVDVKEKREEDEEKGEVATEKVEEIPSTVEDALIELENGLYKEIASMKKTLETKVGNFRDFSAFAKEFNEKSKSKMLCFEKWANSKEISYLELARILKNYLYYLTVLVPSYITRSASVHVNMAKWKYNKQDKVTIKNYLLSRPTSLNSYVDDKILQQILNQLEPCFKSIYETISLIHGCFPESNESLYKQYMLFCIYYVFYRMVHIEESLIESITKDDENEDTEIVDFTDKVTIEHKMISFMRFLVGSDPSVKNTSLVRFTNTFTRYRSIQENIDKLRANEREQIQVNFKSNNKKLLMVEKALKKVRMGDYYTNVKQLQKYGKRDQYTRDTNYLKTTKEEDEMEEAVDKLWNNDNEEEEYDYEKDVLNEMSDAALQDYDDETLDEMEKDDAYDFDFDVSYSNEYRNENDDYDIMENRGDF